MDQNSFVLVSDFGRIEKPADEIHFVDKEALPGLPYFYRLRDVSADGAVAYSKIVAATFGGAQEYVAGRLYPNPARERFFLEFTAIVAGDLEMQLIDGTGRLVHSQLQSLSAGQPSAAFDLPLGLTSGVYHAKFDFNGQHFSHKVVVAAQD
ncbi:MAG: hypothetical protein RLZZ519_1028 [Bacteroidota bacterium]|jgi:hypothetical protein